jgi:pyridoxamine 5'-phosphate oxidase
MTQTNVDTSSLNLPQDPVDGMLKWLAEAESAQLPEPTAMALGTASKDGRPSVRIVLFKGLSASPDGRRFPRFYTNYDSRKSRELSENPHAALAFFWPQLNRQIRIEGRIERLSAEDSTRYFHSRPRGSQIGAWASPQSRKIPDRAELLKLVEQFENRFKEGEIPRPENWGGWHLVPERIEFWQAGEFRLHDRFVYEWSGHDWKISRLAP